MNDQNDDAQNFALMVLAGVVALVIAGVLALAIATTGGQTAKGGPAARERLVMDKPRVTLGGADAREARRVEMRPR